MPFVVTMPKLTPTMEEGTIARWVKKEGDFVEADEVLLEIATDKATVEHNALDEGYLRRILVGDGNEAQVNQPIAIFTADKEESIEGFEVETPPPPAAPAEEVKEEVVGKTAAPAATAMATPGVAPPPPLEGYALKAAEPTTRVLASPLAKKIALDKGLDLTTITGSGPGGRIVEKDLVHAQPAGLATFGSQAQPTVAPGTFESEKLTPMRKVIGQRLQQSKTFIPHFYVTDEANAGPMWEAREQLKTYGQKISFNDLVMRAVALVLREMPVINSGYNSVDDTIIRYKTVDVCVAVSIPDGLITPIVRHADYKNIGQISAEVKDLATRARHGQLDPEEYTGGSFTVSNLGMYGISDFVGVINPPQGALLAVGGIKSAPIVEDGQVVPGRTMRLTLSADHRVIDGAEAAQFVARLRHLLENPSGLLL